MHLSGLRMPQLFTRSATFLMRFLLVGGPLAIVIVWAAAFGMYRVAPATPAEAPQQPVPFDHQSHTRAGIDCRYCHTAVEQSAFAGIPSASTCMDCHRHIWRDSPLLLPVSQSAAGGPALQWKRVSRLPDHVIFDHSIHLAKGVGCDTCHGRVDQMRLVSPVRTYHMAWCLDCHRHPERYVRPRSEVLNLAWQEPENREQLGRELVAEYGIRRATDCSVCHY